MRGESRRCEMHGTALTSAGRCILCERRTHVAQTSSGRGMVWLIVGVVGAAIAAAVGLRIQSALADRAAAAARRDPTLPIATAAAVAPPTAAASLAPIGTPAAAPIEPHADPNEARRLHELRIAEAERSVQIDLYGEGWCPSCRKARAWLDANAIPYTYRDTSDAVNKHTMRALNPNSTIPTIDIEGEVLVGFDPQRMRASIRRAAEVRIAKAAASPTR